MGYCNRRHITRERFYESRRPFSVSQLESSSAFVNDYPVLLCIHFSDRPEIDGRLRSPLTNTHR